MPQAPQSLLSSVLLNFNTFCIDFTGFKNRNKAGSESKDRAGSRKKDRTDSESKSRASSKNRNRAAIIDNDSIDSSSTDNSS